MVLASLGVSEIDDRSSWFVQIADWCVEQFKARQFCHCGRRHQAACGDRGGRALRDQPRGLKLRRPSGPPLYREGPVQPAFFAKAVRTPLSRTFTPTFAGPSITIWSIP